MGRPDAGKNLSSVPGSQFFSSQWDVAQRCPVFVPRFSEGQGGDFLRRTQANAETENPVPFTLLPPAFRIEDEADVAQLVEQPIRNRQVNGSSPFVGSTPKTRSRAIVRSQIQLSF